MSETIRELWEMREQIAPMYYAAFVLCPCEECAVVLVERLALTDELIAATIVAEHNRRYALEQAKIVAHSIATIDFWQSLGAIDSTMPTSPVAIEITRWYAEWHARWRALPKLGTDSAAALALAFELCVYQSKNALRRARAVQPKFILELVLQMQRAASADADRKDRPHQ